MFLMNIRTHIKVFGSEEDTESLFFEINVFDFKNCVENPKFQNFTALNFSALFRSFLECFGIAFCVFSATKMDVVLVVAVMMSSLLLFFNGRDKKKEDLSDISMDRSTAQCHRQPKHHSVCKTPHINLAERMLSIVVVEFQALPTTLLTTTSTLWR